MQNLLPVVAIVGRPNVGKSTLFNAFTKTRNAIVANIPGVTRDRQYGEVVVDLRDLERHRPEVKISGESEEGEDVPDLRRWIVIDTGGIDGHEETDLELLMAKQSWQAVEEADLILFMVDAREGVTPGDQALAEKLRTVHKPLILVINKLDGLDEAVHTAEFHLLGFSEWYPIAASHHRGVSILMNAIIQYVYPELLTAEQLDQPVSQPDSIKVAVIGKPNVGKSTLMNRMLGEDRVIVLDQPGTTRDSIYIPLERLGKHYTLIDTAGVRRRNKVHETLEKFSVIKTLQAVSDSHVVLFVVDALEGFTDQDAKLLGYVIESGRAFIVVVNKWDGLTVEQKKTAEKSIDRKLTFADYAKIQKISALHGTGVGDLFSMIEKAYRSAAIEISTAKATELLEQAIAEHEPPLVNGRRIKLRYAHMGGHHPPCVVIHGNQVVKLPNSYVRYLENFYRQKLKLVGTPIRLVFKASHNPYVSESS